MWQDTFTMEMLRQAARGYSEQTTGHVNHRKAIYFYAPTDLKILYCLNYFTGKYFWLHSSLNFNTYTELCNYHQNQDLKQLFQAQNTHSCYPFMLTPYLTPHPCQLLICFPSLYFCFPECDINGIIKYIIFETGFFHSPQCL